MQKKSKKNKVKKLNKENKTKLYKNLKISIYTKKKEEKSGGKDKPFFNQLQKFLPFRANSPSFHVHKVAIGVKLLGISNHQRKVLLKFLNGMVLVIGCFLAHCPQILRES
jgi:hypothetical protein